MVRLINERETVTAVRESAWPLAGREDLTRVLSWIGDAQVVFLGEATRGTHDFYAVRSVLTRRLIEERGFSAVAVDADWIDAHIVNRFVLGYGGSDPAPLLGRLGHFPGWLWRNTAVAEFAGWLNHFNLRRPERKRVGFFGLDLHATQASLRTADHFLRHHRPAFASAAAAYFAGLDQCGESVDEPVPALLDELGPDVSASVIEAIDARREAREGWLWTDGPVLPDHRFYLEQGGRVERRGAAYYRRLLDGRHAARTVRARHAWGTLRRLLDFQRRRGRSERVVVWAGTGQVARRPDDLPTLGQLAGDALPGRVRSIALTTHAGTVAAAPNWGAHGRVMTLEAPLPESLEQVLHGVGAPRFFLPLNTDGAAAAALDRGWLQRSVGWIYRPEQERWTHYETNNPAAQFDALLHVDVTHAVEPLETMAEWK